jgi:LysR family transcriptional regulator, glycine cleavage system transcriptional activator
MLHMRNYWLRKIGLLTNFNSMRALSNEGVREKAIPPLASLRAFEAVGRLGGIRRAATSLGLDHSVVSRHLRQLEDWVGAALLQRTAGQVTLTEFGARYHGRISAALAELALATSEISNRHETKKVLVWCVPGFAAQWIADRIARFEAQMPDCAIEVRPTDVGANLLAHEADVDIRFYLDDWPPAPGGRGLHYVELARPSIMIVASPSLAEELKDIALADLVDAPLIHEEHDHQWRSWLSLNNVKDLPAELPGPLLWHAHLAIAAARNGRGLALVSTYLVEADLRAGTLVELKVPEARQVVIGAYAYVTRADRWSADGIIEFRRFLQSEVSRFNSEITMR